MEARVHCFPGWAGRHITLPWASILVLCLLAIPSPALPGEHPRQGMLAVHNAVRDGLGLPPLGWSSLLETTAQDWVDHLALHNGCTMKHSGPGENLFWASPLRWPDGRTQPQLVSPEQVARAWASEHTDYDYASNTCRTGRQCGHYTQMVWRATTHVGCAYRICGNDAQVWACHYRPVGNYVGQRPY